MDKPKLGDSFFLVKEHYREPDTSTVCVKKIGRKYFWVGLPRRDPARESENFWTKFKIENHHCADEFGDYKLYKTEQEYLDRTKAIKLFTEIDRTYFKYSLPDSITLDKLKRIKAILEEK